MMTFLRLLAIGIGFSVLPSYLLAGGMSDGQGNDVSISGAAFQSRAGTDDTPFTRYDGRPIAHFRLGEYDSVDRLEIRWSTGGETVIPGSIEAGHLYSLERTKSD